VQVSNKLSGFIEVKSIIAGIPTDEPIKGAGSGFKHTEQTGQVAAQDLLQGNSVSLVGVLLKIDK
jgi:hypothetical protein